ncbi:M48 family metalloprotease [Nitrospirillum amazonense]|uniref:M48 family metalloprotease n=1 Tax=Nitrospirillum amazonense TaxID=28077 RepID=UPI0030CB41DF
METAHRAGVRPPPIRWEKELYYQACVNLVTGRVHVDTRLLEVMPDPYIEALLAHEVGHLQDRGRALLTQLLLMIVMLLSMVLPLWVVWWFHGIPPDGQLPWQWVAGALASGLLLLWFNMWAMEWELDRREEVADRFAVQICSASSLLEMLLFHQRLVKRSLGPSLLRRLKVLEAWAG